MGKNLEHDVTSIAVLLVVGAIIADLITHGTATAAVLRPILQLFNSGLSIASGNNPQTVTG
ncbi:MAG: hypothetical protein ACYDCL_21475 [Myxococcales bacterium]